MEKKSFTIKSFFSLPFSLKQHYWGRVGCGGNSLSILKHIFPSGPLLSSSIQDCARQQMNRYLYGDEGELWSVSYSLTLLVTVVIWLTPAQAMVPAFLSSYNNSTPCVPSHRALYLQVLLQTKAHGNDTLILDSPSLYPHFSQPKIGACLNRGRFHIRKCGGRGRSMLMCF